MAWMNRRGSYVLRPADRSGHQNGNGELVSEPLREMVSERLRSARTVGPNPPGIADEMGKNIVACWADVSRAWAGR